MIQPLKESVRFDAGGSRVRLTVGSCQDFLSWYCSLFTRRTVCGRAGGNTPRTQIQIEWNESRECTNPRWSRSRSAGVNSGRSLHFRLEQEPESIFQAQAREGAGVYIKVCAGANQNF